MYDIIIFYKTIAVEHPIILLYFAAVITDIILGNVRAWTTNSVDSDIATRGTVKHLGIMVFVVLFLPVLSLYLDTSLVSVTVVSYITYQYSISIIENLGMMGIKMPDVFEKSLQRLDYKGDDYQDDEETKDSQ